MRNTVIAGSDVSYEVSTPTELLHSGDRVTTITRVGQDDTKVIVGEIIWNRIAQTRVRMLTCGGGNGEWLQMRDFLRKRGGSPLSTARSFSGTNGVQYRWKLRGVLPRYMTLGLESEPDNDDLDTPNVLAVYHPPRRNIAMQQVRSAFLEVSPTLESTLDAIIVTFLMMERKERDRQKWRRDRMRSYR